MILIEEEMDFLQNKKDIQEWLIKSQETQISESNCSCKKGQCTCKESEEEITNKVKEPEMLRSLGNIVKSIAAICKQLKTTILKLQTTSNMLKKVICKIDYKEEATSSEKCQIMIITKEINLIQAERLLKVKIKLRQGRTIAMIDYRATRDFITSKEEERLELVTENIPKREQY